MALAVLPKFVSFLIWPVVLLFRRAPCRYMSSCPALGAVQLLWAVFLECPGCLQWKQSRPLGALDLLSGLLLFTPSPFADLGMCCSGELDTGWCVSAAGMEGWVARLVFVPIGDCCLGCVVDDCGVF